jgi:ADP-heptose:LPS heptosyltransferase
MPADKNITSRVPGDFVELFKSASVHVLLRLCNAAFITIEAFTRFRPGDSQPLNILIVRTGALGDFLLAIPAMHRLRQAYPAAKLTLLTTATTDRSTLKTVNAYSNQGSPWLSIFPANIIDEIISFGFSTYLDLISKGRKSIIRRKYDVCFILNEGIGLTLAGTAKKIIFMRMLGVGCRIYGIRTRAYPKIFPLVQRGPRRLEHHVDAIMRSVEENAHVADTPLPEIYFGIQSSTEAEEWATAQLAKLLEKQGTLIVVAPGSRLEFKRWPAEYYTELIIELLKKPQITIALVGSGPELETALLVEEQYLTMTKNSGALYNLAGKTSIDQLTALLKHAAVFVGNDGGTCHLAAAAGCKVVSISNGAEIPNSVEPWDNQRFTARFDVPCAPCYSFTFCPKGNNRCVTGISPDVVLKLVEKALLESSRLKNQPESLPKP